MISCRRSALLGVALLVLGFSGCSPKVVKINGKLLKGGKPMVVSEDTYVTLSFIPEGKEDSKATSYSAKFEQKSGTYTVQLPPGNYRTMLIVAPPSKPRPDGKLNVSRPIRPDRSYDLSRSQELDIEVPGS